MVQTTQNSFYRYITVVNTQRLIGVRARSEHRPPPRRRTNGAAGVSTHPGRPSDHRRSVPPSLPNEDLTGGTD